MKPKLYFPLWVHLPAASLFLVSTALLVIGRPWPESLPMHWNGAGDVNRYGSPWELLTFLGMMLFYLLGSFVADEYWARRERERKRYNWFSLFDEVLVGLFSAIIIAYYQEYVLGRENTLPFDGPMTWSIILGAVAVAAWLEWVRPFVPKPAEPERKPEERMLDNTVVEEVRVAMGASERWVYIEGQNPWWMNLVLLVAMAALAWGTWLTWQAPDARWISYVEGFFVLFTLVFVGGLRVYVSRTQVRVKWGLFGIPVLKLALAEVVSVKPHDFSPIADFGGWGIRISLRSGMKGYYIRGSRGVLMETKSGKKYLVGSDDADRLAVVIETARTTGEER